jgi:hypothetical protein
MGLPKTVDASHEFKFKHPEHGASEVRFYEGKHIYFYASELRPEWERLVSVTAIGKHSDGAREALIWWEKSQIKKALEAAIPSLGKAKTKDTLQGIIDNCIKRPAKSRDASGDYGSALHKWWNQQGEHVLGQRKSAPRKALRGTDLAAAQAALLDFETTHGECSHTEQLTVHGDYGYAGTLDRLIKLGRNKYLLADLKTSNRFYRNQFHQLAGYALAVDWMGLLPKNAEIVDWVVLHLPRGATEVTPHYASAMGEGWRAATENVFISARAIEAWHQTYNPRSRKRA